MLWLQFHWHTIAVFLIISDMFGENMRDFRANAKHTLNLETRDMKISYQEITK